LTTSDRARTSKGAAGARSGAAAAVARLTGVELAVLGLFFLSGASALVYQVVWSRLFTFVFGGTAAAIGTVLAAYMAGLALGSYVFGRRIDRGGHPLVVYAILEAGIAVWAIVLPFVLDLFDGLYGNLYRSLNPGPLVLSSLRFTLSFLVLLVPTILMGGTLPVLSRLLVEKRSAIGLKAGLLYGTNTVGAVVGTAAAGFFLIPIFGMRTATWIAIAFNLLVTLLGLLLAKRIPRPAAEDAPDAAPAVADAGPTKAAARAETAAAPTGPSPLTPTPVRRAALIVYALSGFSALVYEVAWVKVLSGALGTTTYAFSAMLTTFLLGLSIGALLFARLADRFHPARLFALTQLGIALLVLLGLPLFGNLPVLFIEAFRTWGPSWEAQNFARFLLCAVTMLPPTILMGGAFPLVARIYADRSGGLGRQVGELYAANTVGAILGSFSAGFILVPTFGRQTSLLIPVAMNLLAAAFLLAALARVRLLTRGAGIAAVATAAAILVAAPFALKRWDPYLMASGAYVYADSYAQDPDFRKSLRSQRLVHFREESEAILSVWRSEHVLSLRTNGKVEASTSGDMLTQQMISHLPLLYHPAPDDVLMIGLASGISMGSVLVHPTVKKADCVEMLGGMREVSDYFREWNHDCLRDPRTTLIINDGRNHLDIHDTKYDVIISQPSNPWIVGIGSLFTREFFALGASRLKEGGVFCQWVQTYQMSRRDFGSILRTYHEVFPHVTIWMGVPGDVILIGSREPLALPRERLLERLAVPSVAADLRTVGVDSPEGFLVGYLGSAETIAALTRPAGPVITDDNLLLEFSMPRNLYDPKVDMMDPMRLVEAREPMDHALTTRPEGAADWAATAQRLFAGRTATLTGILEYLGGRSAEAVVHLERAIATVPEDPLAAQYLGISRNEIGIRLLQGGQTTQAMNEFERVTEVGSRSEQALARNNIGLQLFTQGLVDSARRHWQIAADLVPGSPIIRFNLALALDNLGETAGAILNYRAVIDLDPENGAALNNLAWILAQDPATAGEAVAFAARAVALEPTPGNRDTHGFALLRAGRSAEAERLFRDILSDAPDDPDARLHLAMLLSETGRSGEARPILEALVRGAAGTPAGASAAEILRTLP
jgi:spermidine synthase